MGMLDGSLSGKVALITGAGQGVGQGIAFSLAKAGAAVAVTGRTASKVEDTCKQIEARGGRAIALACNVKSEADLKKTVDETVRKLGGIQILVNNAQEVPLGPLDGVSDAEFTAGWESGPLATFRLMKLCRPHLAKRGGSIVNLASTSAMRWDMSNYGCYAAVKEAIRSLTRAAACEWATEGIRTNAILPLATSPGLANWIQERPEESAAFLATVPMRYAGECEEDIGDFVALMCSEGSRYLNGQCIALDGGQAHMG